MGEMIAEDLLAEAERRHRALAIEVERLEQLAYLTPDEQRTIKDLKKMKLAAKDALFGLRR